MHDGNRTDLFLRELVGTLEIVNLDLAGIVYRTKVIGIRITRR
jgi:hypothetical protein